MTHPDPCPVCSRDLPEGSRRTYHPECSSLRRYVRAVVRAVLRVRLAAEGSWGPGADLLRRELIRAANSIPTTQRRDRLGRFLARRSSASATSTHPGAREAAVEPVQAREACAVYASELDRGGGIHHILRVLGDGDISAGKAMELIRKGVHRGPREAWPTVTLPGPTVPKGDDTVWPSGLRLVRNAARCRRCGDEIESRHLHDFTVCGCGAIAVDGGLDYQKRSGDPADFEDLSEWEGT